MTMTHKEAVAEAVKSGEVANDMIHTVGMEKSEVDTFIFTAMLRAYLDARGLVMVPREPTGNMMKAWDNYKGEVMWGMRDVHYPSVGHGSYAAMLSAAPDPFKE